MNVLVFCPFVSFDAYAPALRTIYSQYWQGRLDYLFMRGGEDPNKGKVENVSIKYRMGQDVFLRGDYDAMLTVEQDMVLPPNALWRLSRVQADIVYGLYCFRNGTPIWNVFAELDEGHGQSVFQVNPRIAKRGWGQVIDCVGLGLGCTLIRRHVLETIEFRYSDPFCCDWMLALDAQRAGFSQKADLGTVCGHINPPDILWPARDTRKGYIVEQLGNATEYAYPTEYLDESEE